MLGNNRIKLRFKGKKLRKSRKLCKKCGKREAKYVRRVKKSVRSFRIIKNDRTHGLCRRCFESTIDSFRSQFSI